MLSGGWGNEVVLSREKDGRVLHKYNGFSSIVLGVEWLLNGQAAAVASKNEVILLNVAQKRRETSQDTTMSGSERGKTEGSS